MTKASGRSLTPDQISRITQICARFEHAFQRGKPLTIEAMTAGTETVIRTALLQSLAELEIQYQTRQGTAVNIENYLTRWPELNFERLQTALSVAAHTTDSAVVAESALLSATEQTELIPACSADEFLLRLRKSGLFSDNDVDAIAATVCAFSTAKAAGVQLLAEGKLTEFQMNALLENNGDPLAPGEYIVLDLVGRGGMGTVYRAIHRKMKRVVALKFIRRDHLHPDLPARRFMREVEVAAKLCHPNIVTAYDAGEFHGQSFLVSEFVEGQNLGELVRQYGPLALPVAVDIIQQAARALAYAHGEGVIHRDVKPSNLLLDDAGNVKLLDTGLARVMQQDADLSDSLADLTGSGLLIGTVDYMSPEQAKNAKLADERADVYSLGCALYFLLTGRAPYANGTMIERLLAHRDKPVPSLQEISSDVPESLNRLLTQMLAKKPADRVGSMEEVVCRLEEMKQDGLPDITLPLCSMNEEKANAALREASVAPTCLASTIEFAADSESLPQEPCVLQSAETSIMFCDRSVDSLTSADDPKSFDPAEPEQLVVYHSGHQSTPAMSLAVWVLSGLAAVVVVLALVPRQNPEFRNQEFTNTETAKTPAVAQLSEMTIEEVTDYRISWARASGTDEEQIVHGVVFVLIPPGKFLFGEVDRFDEVTIENEYWLSEVEITVGQFRTFVEGSRNYQTLAERNGNGWGKSEGVWVQRPEYSWKNLGENFVGDSTPACSITYPDAIAFCDWMSMATGKRIRLPTEQEWEYACRCGRRGTWSFGNDESQLDEYAWTRSNSHGEIHSVRSLLPNAWGLFDMHGNEFEWCLEPGALSRNFSGTGPVRGGNFSSIPDDTWSGARKRARLTEPAMGAFRILMEREP